jgi:DNA polymerase elongation subunit (family B)
MGYLIGGNKDDAPTEIKEQGRGFAHLSNEELIREHEECVKAVTKWSNFQMVRKICLNSLYGAIGNQYFRHYKLDNAEAITLTGQVAIRWIERKLNEYLNSILKTDGKDYVIASDTDSVYLSLGHLVDVFIGSDVDTERVVDVLNQFCKDKIEPFINASYKELSEYLNCYEETLVMKRECIAERGIWTAKKRYILNVWDNEGVRYEEPKLKMMGIEAVKSSTPAPCRRYIEQSLKILMRGTEDELIEYIDKVRQEFNSLRIDEIAFPRSANNLGKFADSGTIYRKSTPMHVRGSLLFNFLLKEKKILHKYNLINDGEKIKFVYLKVPNPISENVMSFITEFPDELGLKEFVDYDTMFVKGFLDPLQVILDVLGWRTEKVTTLDDFFS